VTFDLSDNLISVVPEYIDQLVSSGVEFLFSGNPLACDKRHCWIRQGHPALDSLLSPMMCHQPEVHNGTAWGNVTTEMLLCGAGRWHCLLCQY
jgi:hypothetical protein